mgnify:CR=1 FL=1|tara:strand:+ start:813 stop:1235 length:423 start_codon:yes stop_codon:yes gene_type:complete
MASTVYNGTNLLLKFAVDGSTPVTLGHTTSATLTITHDLPESTSKDSSGFQEVISGLRSGEISFEGLVDYTDTLNHDEIFTMVSNRSKVDFTFGTIITGDAVLSGEGFISNLEINADMESAVTFSGTIVTTGAITQANNA